MPSCTTPDSYPNDSIPTTKTRCIPVIHTAATVAGKEHEITHPLVDEWMMETSCILHSGNILNHKENIFFISLASLDGRRTTSRLSDLEPDTWTCLSFDCVIEKLWGPIFPFYSCCPSY